MSKNLITALPPITAEEEARLVLAAQAGDTSAAETLVRTQIRQIAKLAMRHRRGNVELEDLISAGVEEFLIGLQDHNVAANERYLWIKRVNRRMLEEALSHFSPVSVPQAMLRRYRDAIDKTATDAEGREYATSAERGSQRMDPLTFDAIHRLTRPLGIEGRLPNDRTGSYGAEGESLGQGVADALPERLGPTCSSVEDQDEAQRLLAVLDERERRVMEMHAGFQGEPMKDGEIAQVLGIDRSRIVRIRQAAVAKMAAAAQK